MFLKPFFFSYSKRKKINSLSIETHYISNAFIGQYTISFVTVVYSPLDMGNFGWIFRVFFFLILRENFHLGIRMEGLYIQFNAELPLQFASSIHLSPEKPKGVCCCSSYFCWKHLCHTHKEENLDGTGFYFLKTTTHFFFFPKSISCD